MLNRALVQTRLGQFGGLWPGSLLAALLAIAGGAAALKVPVPVMADAVLPIMLAALALAMAGYLVLTLVSDEGVLTKAVLALAGLVLVLPLLWAPVLGAVAAAALAGASIEYSQSYAQFRIDISRLLYPLAGGGRAGSALHGVWSLFQAVATVVGFLPALVKAWAISRRLAEGRPLEPAD